MLLIFWWCPFGQTNSGVLLYLNYCNNLRILLSVLYISCLPNWYETTRPLVRHLKQMACKVSGMNFGNAAYPISWSYAAFSTCHSLFGILILYKHDGTELLTKFISWDQMQVFSYKYSQVDIGIYFPSY